MVYFGHGDGKILFASPWGNPFLSASDGECNCDLFAEYLATRCDIVEFLAPFVGNIILCHTIDNHHCDAHVLCEFIDTYFGPQVLVPPTVFDESSRCDLSLPTSVVVGRLILLVLPVGPTYRLFLCLHL